MTMNGRQQTFYAFHTFNYRRLHIGSGFRMMMMTKRLLIDMGLVYIKKKFINNIINVNERDISVVLSY